MTLIQSSPPQTTPGPGKRSDRKSVRTRFLRVFILVFLIAVIIGVWQFLNATLNSTDPVVAGRPLSNPHTHLHTIALGEQPGVVYLGTHYGMFTSADGGRTWPQPRGVLNTLMIMTIASSPANPRILGVIGLPNAGIGTPSGIFFSRDGGITWQHAAPAGLEASAYPFAIQAGAANAGHFYAFYQFGGWFETQDTGVHWRAITTGKLSSMQAPTLLTDPADPNHLLLGGDQGLFESRDDGTRWNPVSGIAGNVLSIVASTSSPRLIFCATDQGLYRWQEGSSQTMQMTQMTKAPASLTRLVIDPTGRFLYGTSGQDLWSSADHGATWTHSSHFERGDMVALVVDPQHPLHLYAGFFLPATVIDSLDGGSSWKTLTN